MKIKTWLKYEVPFVPPRCRKTRYEEREEFVDIVLREAHKKDMVLAYEDKSYEGKGKIYRYKGKLWAKAKLDPVVSQNPEYKDRIKTPLDWLVHCNGHCSTYFFTMKTPEGDAEYLVRHRNRAGLTSNERNDTMYSEKSFKEVGKALREEQTVNNPTERNTRLRPRGLGR